MKIKFDNGRVVEFEGQPSDEDIDYVARQVFAAPPLDDAPKDEWNRYYKATIKPEDPSLVETEVMSPMRSALSTYATAGLAKEGLGAVNPQLKQSLFPEQRTMPGKIFRGGLEFGATVAGLPTKLAISGVKAASKLIPRAVVPVERLAAATLGQKLATGAVGGLIEGATLAPKDLDAGEYGKQIALSGGAGAVLPVIGSAIVNKFPRLMSDEGLVRRVSDKVQTGIWKALRPTIIGKKSQSQLKAFDQKASAAVLDIISNKSNNNFIDEVGNIKPNNLPESIDDMAKAIADGRKRVFAEYNALSQGATDKGAIIGVGNTQSVLEKYATDPVLVAENPSLANFALKQHEALTRRGKFTPLEAEEKIAEWNFDLKSKYNSGEFGIQTTQKALKEMVEALRKDLDSSIQQATGSKLYQGLKNKYGAYKALADEVGRRLPVARRASPSGFFDIADAFASGDMLSGGVGLVTGDPSAPARLLRGLGLNVGKTILKRRNDPNRIIGTMFQDVDSLLNESNRRAISSQTAVGQKAKQFIKRRGEPMKVKGLTIEDVGDAGSGKVIPRSGQVNSAKKFLAERPEDIEIFRGENTSSENRGKGGVGYHSVDKEFAKQFTQTGQISEVKSRKINSAFVYDARKFGEELPSANSETSFDKAMADAKAKGYSAFRLSEGSGEPESIYVFDRKAFSPKTYGITPPDESKLTFKAKIKPMTPAEQFLKERPEGTVEEYVASKRKPVYHFSENAISEFEPRVGVVNTVSGKRIGERFNVNAAKAGKI